MFDIYSFLDSLKTGEDVDMSKFFNSGFMDESFWGQAKPSKAYVDEFEKDNGISSGSDSTNAKMAKAQSNYDKYGYTNVGDEIYTDPYYGKTYEDKALQDDYKTWLMSKLMTLMTKGKEDEEEAASSPGVM